MANDLEFPEAYDLNDTAGDETLDLTGVSENATFAPVPPGTYEAAIVDAAYGISQRSGNPMVTWQFAISSGEYMGRRFFYHTPLVENMLPRLKKLLVRVAPELDLSRFNPKSDPQTLIGKPCQIVLRTRVYEGETRNEVRDVLASKAGGAFLDGLGV